jgi:hypothetical protein
MGQYNGTVEGSRIRTSTIKYTKWEKVTNATENLYGNLCFLV